MRLAYPIIFSFLLCCSFLASGQSLMQTIEKTEKAVFEITGYNNNGAQTGTGSGFFISSDGLAITVGSILEKADSAMITTRNGRDYKIERIVATHPHSNLTLVKVQQTRQKGFSYLIPAKQSFKEFEELLVFTHEQETEQGTSLARMGEINYFPFIKRCGIINASYGTMSHGAPVINQKGELTGIINGLSNDNNKIVYNSHLLNDTSWFTINKQTRELQFYPQKSIHLNSHLSQSIIQYLTGQYMESAKTISRHLKSCPNDAVAYSLRGITRHRYKNSVGSREDFQTAISKNANCHYAFYFKALVNLDTNNPKEAQINLDLCLSRMPTFAPAIVEATKLKFNQNKDTRWAMEQYTKAVENDSLYADAFYERARLVLQYFNNTELSGKDINQAIYLNPNLAGVYSIRGTIKFSNEDFLDAINDFNKALEKDPEDVYAYFNRAVAQYNIGLKENACKDWQKAGELGNYKAFRYISRYCNEVRRGYYDNHQ